ncbi:hypothetical protein [Endozoicomonas sp. ALC066]|uniref:hypothetical protein n=1 Tax=Endozoicomonas sp. ALC066 TaxID=3403078 RepID=UPI003BB7C15A
MNVSYPKESDRHVHNCDECEFLGRIDYGGKPHDLYIHSLTACRTPQSRRLGWNLTARYGSNKAAADTYIVFANASKLQLEETLKNPLAKLAWEVAIDAGALDMSGMVGEALTA